MPRAHREVEIDPKVIGGALEYGDGSPVQKTFVRVCATCCRPNGPQTTISASGSTRTSKASWSSRNSGHSLGTNPGQKSQNARPRSGLIAGSFRRGLSPDHGSDPALALDDASRVVLYSAGTHAIQLMPLAPCRRRNEFGAARPRS